METQPADDLAGGHSVVEDLISGGPIGAGVAL
jgi:hypothetical protein